MSYEPQEGVDYIIDLYAVAGVERDVTGEELRTSINQRTLEYHPDRLEGLAPEFREKGEQMSVLLNRARVVLLDEERRSGYDQLLEEWQGVLSDDGTPVMTIKDYLMKGMADKDPEEVEEIFGKQKERILALTGYSPNRLEFLEKLINTAGGDVSPELRAEYETALHEYDVILALQESERSELLGIDLKSRRYEASFDYADKVTVELETARETTQAELEALAVGSFATRLALLAGDDTGSGGDLLPSTYIGTELPAFFDPQVEKVKALAKEREELLLRRLANFEPTYPESDLQEEAQEGFIVGVSGDSTMWFSMSYDPETETVNADTDLTDEFLALLAEGNFKEVIERGFNVFTFKLLDQIDIHTLIDSAVDKHVNKYGLRKED